MAQNSFSMKGWAYAIPAAFIALSLESLNFYMVFILAIIFMITFWWLDAFFLKTEKLYRFKYNWVIKNRPKGELEHLYDLNPHNKKTVLVEDEEAFNKITVFRTMFSKPGTLRIFYGIPILALIVICLLKIIENCFSCLTIFGG